MLKRIEPGTVFGHLTVMNHPGSNKHGQAMFGCQCACGKMVIVAGYKLRRGESRSCGCKRAALKLATEAIKGVANTDTPDGTVVVTATKPQYEEAPANA